MLEAAEGFEHARRLSVDRTCADAPALAGASRIDWQTRTPSNPVDVQPAHELAPLPFGQFRGRAFRMIPLQHPA